jgi:hypothetical protein
MIKDSFVEGAYFAPERQRIGARDSPSTEPGIGIHGYTTGVTWALVGHLGRCFLVGFQLTEDATYPGCC